MADFVASEAPSQSMSTRRSQAGKRSPLPPVAEKSPESANKTHRHFSSSSALQRCLSSTSAPSRPHPSSSSSSPPPSSSSFSRLPRRPLLRPSTSRPSLLPTPLGGPPRAASSCPRTLSSPPASVPPPQVSTTSPSGN